jgi:hypothetical protein
MIENPHEESRGKTFIIASDSKSALKAIANPSNKSDQQIVRAIFSKADNLRTQDTEVYLL